MFLLPAINELFARRGCASGRSHRAKTLNPGALVLAPTRELAVQIFEESKKLCAGTGLKSVCIYGGDSTKSQAERLSAGSDLVIATPGRLQMFIERGAVSLRDISFLVVDEADRMLDMGFEPQLRFILRKLGSAKRTTVMCSATFPEDIQYLAANFLHEDYFFVSVGRVGSTTELITQQLIWAEDNQKDAALLRLLDERSKVDRRTLIFSNTKERARALFQRLKRQRFKAEEIHGDRTQAERENALRTFKSGQTSILVATDVASRGLDVADIDHVIQYDAPKDSDSYTHRIGRTGRGGERGTATAFMNARQKGTAAAVLRQLREVGQSPPNWLIGMAHMAQREHEVLVNKNLGSREVEEGEEFEFGGQDFRKTAKKGTWGAQKDLRFTEFDEKAYEGSSVTEEESDEGAVKYGSQSADLEEVIEEEEISDEEIRRLAVEKYKRPKPSDELIKTLKSSGYQLRREPAIKIERMLLGRSKKLFYEYMAMFPPEAIDTSSSRFKESTGNLKKILMVAEKPSVAESIAGIISKGQCRKRRGLGRNVPVFEFFAEFPSTGEKVVVRVTSVVGHVFSVAFNESAANGNWRRDPGLLFNCPITKKVEETADKLMIVEHLKNEAEGCAHLVLWLDCDREGENIAHEVISVTRDTFSSDSNIHRARFSALTNSEISSAFGRLARPNPNESMAVDARQELDLKVGVAFSRLLTNSFAGLVRRKYRDDIKLLSYGPCQTPTLFFCVDRFNEMLSFERQPYWAVRVQANVGSEVVLRWSKESTFDQADAERVRTEINKHGRGIVSNVRVSERTRKAPNGLNTVQLLMACSKSLGISPKKTMQVAEKLYTAGYVSYPRTETSQYPQSMSIKSILNDHKDHPDWGKTVDFVSRQNPAVPTGGVSVGDHPPITPTKSATRSELQGGLEWRVYEFIARHFFGSLMGDLKYREINSDIQVGALTLVHRQVIVDRLGFAGSMKWNLGEVYRIDEEFKTRSERDSVRSGQMQKMFPRDPVTFGKVQVIRNETAPPQFLQEHELVSLMDKHGIGTDASMAGHISTIVDRSYVVVCDKEGVPIPVGRKPGSGGRKPAGGRYLVPTTLGLNLIKGILDIDSKLVLPEIRAMMEKEVSSIAQGELDKAEVMEKNLAWFEDRFENFRENLETMQSRLYEGLIPARVHWRQMRAFFPEAPAENSNRSKISDSNKSRRRRSGKPGNRSGSRSGNSGQNGRRDGPNRSRPRN
eukprot:CAMPEP_0184752286 /NCGR_PEP_ID=MMETSP0315-20130426/43496_1 /TAXON_ID=101924 /ORGANISM="Rhodosorus marinus, Strain UTEX LB 2760" /LENGTH=1224 /DNA_ID=CAMNT_0027231605 /DNA_START=189 /DNA_END=3863 /DNA_ORIENTATION=+